MNSLLTPVNVSEIPDCRVQKNSGPSIVRAFLESGYEACKVDVSGQSTPAYAQMLLANAVHRICRGKVSVLRRNDEVYLVRKEAT